MRAEQRSARERRLPAPSRARTRGARAAGRQNQMHELKISVEVNGKVRTATVPARLSLVDWLRDEMRLTGTIVGCEHGICGACSVMIYAAHGRPCHMYTDPH